MAKSFEKLLMRFPSLMLGLALVLGLSLASVISTTAHAEEQKVRWDYSILQRTLPNLNAGESKTIDGITLHVLKGAYRPYGDSGATFAGDGAESFQFSTTRGNFTVIKMGQNVSCLNEINFKERNGWRNHMEFDRGLYSDWKGESNVVTFGERTVPDWVEFTIAVADPAPNPPAAPAPAPAEQTPAAPAPVAVTNVSLSLSSATVQVGDKVALTAAISPADATNKKVRWSVTADNDGLALFADEACTTLVGTDATDALTVYAKVDNKAAVGRTSKITVASDADGAKSAACDITSIAPKEEVVASTNAPVPHDQKAQGLSVTATSPEPSPKPASRPASTPVQSSAPKPAVQTEMTAEK